jgi:hypothetical protein
MVCTLAPPLRCTVTWSNTCQLPFVRVLRTPKGSRFSEPGQMQVATPLDSRCLGRRLHKGPLLGQKHIPLSTFVPSPSRRCFQQYYILICISFLRIKLVGVAVSEYDALLVFLKQHLQGPDPSFEWQLEAKSEHTTEIT